MNRRSNIQKCWWMAGFFVAFLCFANALKASQAADRLSFKAVQKEWAIVKYQAPETEKVKLFEQLIQKLETHASQDADLNFALWHAITLSSYAQLKGGLSGLNRAKEAKQLLETALEKNGQLGDGLGHAVLGALYARVPGWPVGFGDKAKATWHLKTAYAISPKSMDVNYYYGDFLAAEHQVKAAQFHLEEALKDVSATDPIYNQGRKGEIERALNKMKK
ncbi:MAG: TRAP transporter TatT component family protein [Gammaproteobacteria bacterium]